MNKFIQPIAIIIIALVTTGGMAFAMTPTPTSEKQSVPVQVAEVAEVKEPIEEKPVPEIKDSDTTEEKVIVTDTPRKAPEKQAEPVIEEETSNEDVIWDFLIESGFTRNQTAGIMGNLQQEHNFNTSDEPGGLGIAQWTGGRRERLIERGNHLDLNTQLAFMLDELKTTEKQAYVRLLHSGTADQAVRAFQKYYERCNIKYCNEVQRLEYAWAILERH